MTPARPRAASRGLAALLPRLRLLLLGAAVLEGDVHAQSAPAGVVLQAAQTPSVPESFVRRGCKFRPLPASLDEGYRVPRGGPRGAGDGGSYRVADVFSLPLVALATGGHNVTADVAAGSWLGLRVQVPFATSAVVSVVAALPGAPAPLECERTWGAGGRLKQCSLDRLSLQQGGRLTLSFRAVGMGDLAAGGAADAQSCVPLRVDLEISTQREVDVGKACRQAIAAPPQLERPEQELALAGYSARSAGGVVWSSRIPAAAPDGRMAMLSARLVFPSMAFPMQLLLEEVESNSASTTEPLCQLRCLSGSPIASGQVLRHVLPVGPAFVLWILAPAADCVNFDFEARLERKAAEEALAPKAWPPAWLCEGAPWPARLEQLAASAEDDPTFGSVGSAGSQRAGVLRGRRFALRDVFDLTRPPETQLGGGAGGWFWQSQPWASSGAGLHTLELQVVEPSVLRVSTYGASTPARPLLLRGTTSEAVVSLAQGGNVGPRAARIPTAGGEFRYSLREELAPGAYTLAFAVDIAVGGLRPCTSVGLRVELEPVADRAACWRNPACGADENAGGTAISGVSNGVCAVPAPPSNLLSDLASRMPVTLEQLEASSSGFRWEFQLTLPPPAGVSLGGVASMGEGDLIPIGRSRLLPKLDALLAGSGPVGPIMFRMAVRAPYSELDLTFQVYADGAPMTEPRPLAEGDGYEAVAGPLDVFGSVFYEVVLLRAPVLGEGGSRASPPPVCVTFAVDMAFVVLAPPQALPSGPVPSVPGAAFCQLSAPRLPDSLRLHGGRVSVVDGEFLLPSEQVHSIALEGVPGGADIVARVSAFSRDAEVYVQTDDGSSFREVEALADDRRLLFAVGAAPASPAVIRLRIAPLPTMTVCPLVRLHIVAQHSPKLGRCGSDRAETWADVEGRLRAAFAAQPSESASLRMFSSLVRVSWGAGVPQGAGADFVVGAAQAEFRFELWADPPWLPLEAVLEVAEPQRRGEPIAAAKVSGRRLVMLIPSLPRGAYKLQLRLWDGQGRIPQNFKAARADLCAVLMGSAILSTFSGRDTANFRQEMLNLPELLPVLPLPSALAPTWLAADDGRVSSQMYALPMGDTTVSLEVREASVLRLLAEPADLLAPQLKLQVKLNDRFIMSPEPVIGSVVLRLASAGTYTLTFTPGGDVGCHDNDCRRELLPFMVTWGLLSDAESRRRAVPPVACGPALTPQGAALGQQLGTKADWREKRELAVAGVSPAVAVPLKLLRPSIVFISAWSGFIDRSVRIAFRTEEGVWVGEQRGLVSALEIELPPGEYTLQLEEPRQLYPPLSECVTFGFLVSASAFTPPPSSAAWKARFAALASEEGAGAEAAPWASALGLGPRCAGLGASPAPLDLSSMGGGSEGVGGPMDEAQRLLVRQRFLLTDMHDGRKKVFFKTPADGVLRLTIIADDDAAEDLEVTIESMQHVITPPSAVFFHGYSGWSSAYEFPGMARGAWLALHRERRGAGASGCASFDLLLQAAPRATVEAMRRCPPDGSAVQLGELARLVGGAGSVERFVELPGGAAAEADLVVDIPQPSLVEVDVRFNLLLAFVDLVLVPGTTGALPGAGRLRPVVSAAGARGSPLDARAALRLRLRPGTHHIRVSVRPAFDSITSGGRSCMPLAIHLARAALGGAGGDDSFGGVRGAPVLLSAGPLGPLSRASDFAVVAVRGGAVAADVPAAMAAMAAGPAGAVAAAAAAGAVGATAASGVGGAALAVWDPSTLAAACAAGQGREVVGGGDRERYLALPLRLGGLGGAAGADPALGEVWLLPPGARGNYPPWSGEARPLSSGPPRPRLGGSDAGEPGAGAAAPAGGVGVVRAEVSCTCSPLSGPKAYSCSDGSSGQCTMGKECDSPTTFRKSSDQDGCKERQSSPLSLGSAAAPEPELEAMGLGTPLDPSAAGLGSPLDPNTQPAPRWPPPPPTRQAPLAMPTGAGWLSAAMWVALLALCAWFGRTHVPFDLDRVALFLGLRKVPAGGLFKELHSVVEITSLPSQYSRARQAPSRSAYGSTSP